MHARTERERKTYTNKDSIDMLGDQPSSARSRPPSRFRVLFARRRLSATRHRLRFSTGAIENAKVIDRPRRLRGTPFVRRCRARPRLPAYAQLSCTRMIYESERTIFYIAFQKPFAHGLATQCGRGPVGRQTKRCSTVDPRRLLIGYTSFRAGEPTLGALREMSLRKEIDASQAERLGRSCLSIVPRSRSHARLRRNTVVFRLHARKSMTHCYESCFFAIDCIYPTMAIQCGQFSTALVVT
ncbi:hypothetical protein EVAR_81764_1 [Eumeta japonica]|uniref:Uncharacterized protein n=1 Tax=Eumeta variegata TaxID=151549 RepID=A0A4C1UIT2_EUMVA|nr:hypothetical protein EVAR_81764_1 [Eumeta japonica]